jgi:nitroreductase
METWDIIRARRNVRAFTDEKVSDEALERIMEAAGRTPSGSNRQFWSFVACTEPDVIKGLSETWQGAAWITSAPLVVALLKPKDPDGDNNAKMRDVMQYDLGQATMSRATMSRVLAAADLGIASGQCGIMGQRKASEVLGFPDGWFCGTAIAFGHPADRPLKPIRKPIRKPIDEVWHRERW